MELQTDSWVLETQKTLKGVTTSSLKGQHTRLKRAKERDNWYNTGVKDGQLVKPFKFIDQQELGGQNKSKLLSSIRSHVKHNTYIHQQATKADLERKKRPHLNVLPKVSSNQSVTLLKSSTTPLDASSDILQRHDTWRNRPISFPRELEATSISCLGYNITLNSSHLCTDQEIASRAWYSEAVEALVQWSQSNTILLHVLLYCAACHYRIVTNSDDYSDVFHYRGEAMKIINKNLEDPVERVSNDTLGGLAHLVVTEEMYGSRLAASIHRDGLEKLLKLRRALPGMSMNAIAGYLLPLTNLNLQYEGTKLDHVGDEGPIARRDPILEVFAWLKDTPLQLPQTPSKNESHYCLVRVQLEYNLYSHKPYSSSNRPRRCWLLAALIYLHTIIATPSGWHMLPKMEAHLVGELGELLQEMKGERHDDELGTDVHLWVLLFGGLHARGTDAQWYRKAIKGLVDTHGLSRWEDLVGVVKTLPWVQNDVEKALKEFYSLCTATRV